MNRLIAPGQRLRAFALLLGLISVVSPAVHSQTYSVLHRFTWTDGANPLAGLIASGPHLFGTTSSGGAYGAGTVFEISDEGVETVLYEFKGGADGANPEAALILIGGNLYGTTFAGGASNAGTVFEVSVHGKEKVLYSFTGHADGTNPEATLVQDTNGNLYGTTNLGGTEDHGTVFELVRPKTTEASWTEKVLHAFGKAGDGADPVAGVSFDSSGNLYGTTSYGGTYGDGTVFELTSSKSGWTEKILHSFEQQGDGGIPYAGVVVIGGKLYGAATDGGEDGQSGGGTVFELAPSKGDWNFTILYRLPGWGISGSFQNLLVSSGSIYATTHCDGASSSGTVYKLTPSGSTWTSTSLHEFTGGSDGMFSFSNLVLSNGALYGTTKLGGDGDNGIVFKVALP